MFNQQGQNWGIVSTNLSNALKTLRAALYDAGNVTGWVAAQQEGDLVNIGAAQPDAAQAQVVCQHLLTLIEMANGGPPPTETINYLQEAIDLIGPYA